jgi:hypothetical protein
MKLAVFSESPADEAAIRVLADAVVGFKTARARIGAIQSRGWPAVRNLLPAVIRRLYYGSDAETLVVVCDSDDSTVHELSHPRPAPYELNCRLCMLRDAAEKTLEELHPRPGRSALHVAIGVAVPALEAWLLCDDDSRIDEQAWKVALAGAPWPYTRYGLKRELYGTERPGLNHEMQVMVQHAEKIAARWQLLAERFPNGFGTLADALRHC